VDAVSPAATTTSNLDPPRELALRPSREAFLGERVEGLVGEGRGPPHRLDLALVLDRAKRLDEPRLRDGVDARVDEHSI
jgi:hypothetical protein